MKLLIVEDEKKIRDILVGALKDDGHEVFEAETAEDAWAQFKGLNPEGYILDVLLPGISGSELCRKLRESGVKEPILLLTAMGGLPDKVAGLDAGADDYLTKPFEIEEVKARVRAYQRKVKGYPQQVLSVADLTLDPNRRKAFRKGEDLSLSPREYDFLEFLMRNKGHLVTRAMVCQAVWETDTSIYTNVIDVLLTYLRKKVDGDRLPHLIHTVRGQGFIISDTNPVELP